LYIILIYPTVNFWNV